MPKELQNVDREAFDYIGQPLAVNDLCIIADAGKDIQVGRIIRFTNKMVRLEKQPPRKYGGEVMSYENQLAKLSDDQAILFKLKLKSRS